MEARTTILLSNHSHSTYQVETMSVKVSNNDKAKFYIMRIDSGLSHREAILKTLEWVFWLEKN